jgi:hypothetical protein
MKTLLQSIPAHPLDGIQAKLFEENFALKAGVASDWPETKISMQCLVEKLADSPEVSAKIALGIGNWVLKNFRGRNADALRKLAKCWESGGYDGLPKISGSTRKRGRKDLDQARNTVMSRLMDEARQSGTPFCDVSIRLYANLYCGIKKLSDETVKAWRQSVGQEGLKFHLKGKRGPKKGGKQALRVNRNYSAKTVSKKARKADN